MSFPAYETYKDSGAAWLGAVPGHWQIEKIRHQANLAGEKVDGSGSAANYVGLEHVQSGTGQFVVSFEGMQTEAESTVNTFKTGDVLFGKLRPYLAKAVVAATDGICSSEFLVLRPVSVDPNYLKFCLLFEGFIRTVDASTFGSKMPRVDWTFISQLRLPKPPADEQQAIADYLDTETARIDALIREKEGLVRLLRERRIGVFETLLSETAMSCGGRPSNRFPWLCVVPATWTCLRVKHIVQSFDQGISPQCEARVPDEHEWGVLKVGCVNSGVFNAKESKALPPEIDPIQEITLHEGDVLVSRANTKNLVGRAAMADKPYPRLMLSDKLYRLKLDRNRCNPAFLVGFLTLPAIRVRIEERATGASASMLNIDRRTILELELPLPPIDQQQVIVMAADRESAEIQDLTAHVTAEITLLKELRAATIADAVLGRIDVRTHSATPA